MADNIPNSSQTHIKQNSSHEFSVLRILNYFGEAGRETKGFQKLGLYLTLSRPWLTYLR